MRDNTTEDYVLAGDIGGTKTNLGIFVMGKRRPRIKVFKSFPSSEFNGLEEIVALFLSENRYTLKRACFGVAGTVEKGISRITNLPWVINSLKIKDIFNMENVVLINDLSALAYSVPWLTDSELYPLTRVRAEKKGNISLIASGTGLGQALLIHSENGYIPVASEGGHVDFAPNNALEIGLLGFLLERFDHVSIERVISGTGIINIYDYLRSTGKFSEPEWLFKKIKNNMPAKVINESAREKRQKLCLKTID
ncbi:MAG: glucokinase, partial [Deltaproteobacteria bacterium]|nr:glucokinase [Deltaproteobacteria bacterium]